MGILYNEEDLKEGLILPDSQLGTEIGFTSDKFDGYLWLHENENRIDLVAVLSVNEHKGNLLKVLNSIKSKGYLIGVKYPNMRMRFILSKFYSKEILFV